MQSEPLPMPVNVSTEHAAQALSVLMKPFIGFKVARALDKRVLLAAVFTAIQRPVLRLLSEAWVVC